MQWNTYNILLDGWAETYTAISALMKSTSFLILLTNNSMHIYMKHYIWSPQKYGKTFIPRCALDISIRIGRLNWLFFRWEPYNLLMAGDQWMKNSYKNDRPILTSQTFAFPWLMRTCSSLFLSPPFPLELDNDDGYIRTKSQLAVPLKG